MGKQLRIACAIGILSSLVVSSCSSDDGKKQSDSSNSGSTNRSESPTAKEQPDRSAGACNPTDPTTCLLPWPSDTYTRSDATTDTGLRIDLPQEGMPKNASGVAIQAKEWNRSDGFSPASTLLTHIDGLDLSESKLPPVTDIEQSLAKESSLVLLDATSGERIPAWAELDANAEDPAKQLLMITPAVGLPDGHQIAIALRNLVNTSGEQIEASPEMSQAIDAGENRSWVKALQKEGVDLGTVDMAWSFTVASTESLTGRLVHMWEETKGELGEGAPEFAITNTSDAGNATVIEGTFTTPNYLQGDGGPGSVMNNDDDPDGIPARNGDLTSEFTCTLPKTATADSPAFMMAYGHGLLGSRSEVRGIGSFASLANVGLCALDFIGMSTGDVPTVLKEFEDLTAFRTQPDRMQQGHLAFLLLGRLLRSEQGFTTNAAFQTEDGSPRIQTDRAGFLGASQGGILGAAPSSMTEDWDKVVLAVGGMGYNLLLRRSVDFDKFQPALENNYPDELEQTLVIDLIHQLWVRGENAGYAQHLTRDALAGVSPKQVLLLEAFGDHQVANVATEKLARTLEVGLKSPSLEPGRSTDVTPQWGIEPITEYPYEGSALVVWDFGAPAPPVTNTPPREGEDPHGSLGEEPAALTLLLPFINEGVLDNPCGGQACVTK